MKITKSQLKALVRESVRRQLSESTSPKEAYLRLKELRKNHARDFSMLDRAGLEGLQELMDIRDGSSDYSEYFKKIGPGPYNDRTGRHERSNKFNLRPEDVYALWHKQTGTAAVEEIAKLKREFDVLKDRFKTVGATSTTDGMYGRKRFNVVDTETGDVVASFTDREGSLGS